MQSNGTRWWAEAAARTLIGFACALPSNTASAQPLDYAPMRAVGTLDDKRVKESSGLAASIRNPGLLWTHNDSGDGPRLFLMRTDGRVLKQYTLDLPPGTEAVDWEDMCSFELDGKAWLLVGDVGDNKGRRGFVTLWLVEEPVLNDSGAAADAPPLLPVARRIDVRYADGSPDCESVAFDPTTRTVVLVTKEWPDPWTGVVGFARVYAFPLPEQSTPQPLVLERQATLNLKVVTAGDIAPDGRRAVLLTYGDAYQYMRQEGESWAQAFARDPWVVALGPRGQSEAICYDRDGRSLYITAEKVGRPVWRVEAASNRGNRE